MPGLYLISSGGAVELAELISDGDAVELAELISDSNAVELAELISAGGPSELAEQDISQRCFRACRARSLTVML